MKIIALPINKLTSRNKHFKIFSNNMSKIPLFLCFVVIGFTSCKNPDKEIDRLEIAKKYYEVLEQSNVSEIENLLTDSLLTKETQYDYEQIFTKKEYLDWLTWDAVFEPTYKILEIEQENGTVKAKVSKMDKRISFLHQEPIITEQVIHFENNKINSIETVNYVVFKDSIFVKKRDKLVNWTENNHPELSGFIHDQTKTGGVKYLKAIELYTNKK